MLKLQEDPQEIIVEAIEFAEFDNAVPAGELHVKGTAGLTLEVTIPRKTY